MSEINFDEIRTQSNDAMQELLNQADLKPGKIVVIGCSTSEIKGQRIGSASSVEIAEAILKSVYPLIAEKGLHLAAQCCEHLNRAIVVEEECAEAYRLEIVGVVPHLKAGGAFAAEAFRFFRYPVVVESISAHAGLDIGDTLIGMHLKRIAVPIRGKIKKIGHAHVTMARTRPKLIGGERSIYTKYEVPSISSTL